MSVPLRLVRTKSLIDLVKPKEPNARVEMVKKIDLQTFIPGCSAQQFFDTIYGNAAPMNQYHLLVNSV